MKQISIQDLKAKLSAAIAEAEAGHTIIITRHNEPVAQLAPAISRHIHRGRRIGAGKIKSALKRGTKIPYLSFLLEDRENR